MSQARFDLVTIDAPDTAAAVRFWIAAAGLHEIEREDGDRWIVLGDAGGQRRLGIQRGIARAGTMHLDLACAIDEFDDDVLRLEALGARIVSPARREPYGSIVNLTDPDGYCFDLCAYR